MKKKAIEKVPYLRLKKPMNAEYTGVTAIRIIGHEKHLLLDVYKKGDRVVPAVRIVLTKKDFGTFWPDKGWTRQKIEKEGWSGNEPIWDMDCRNLSRKSIEERNVLESQEDQARIEKWCKQEAWKYRTWWNCIYSYEESITTAERWAINHRKWERRKNALEDRQRNTPPMPKGDFAQRAAGTMASRHILYYKKHGCKAEIACTACGQVAERRWKTGISYESELENYMQEPKRGDYGICPMCRARIEYKCMGADGRGEDDVRHVFLAQRYKENGIVVRWITVKKWWWTEFSGDNSVIEAKEQTDFCEGARAYFELGKECQIDYQKQNPYSGKAYWEDTNICGMRHIEIPEGRIMPESYSALIGTEFQYCAVQEYEYMAGKENMIRYLKMYRTTPQLEMLVKMGLRALVDAILNGRITVNIYAKRFDALVGINQIHAKKLVRSGGDLSLLRAMRMEKDLEQNWTDKQIEQLSNIQISNGQMETVLRYMSLQKFLNRVQKYAGCQIEGCCTSAQSRLQHMSITYADYLYMRERLGYDLANMIYQHPRDLDAAHQQMVLEQNAQKLEKRILEKEKEYAKIKRKYQDLKERYAYEKDGLVIRPARSAEEIIKEGNLLHHCVGGDNYLNSHNVGESYILLLRKTEEQDMPYITVEIDARSEKIRQWYGAYDRKPDKPQIDEWLGRYLKVIEKRIKQELNQTVLQAAG